MTAALKTETIAHIGGRVDQNALLEWMGYESPGPCKRALEAQGIAVFEGRNGIWTTMELINEAGRKKMSSPDNDRDWL